MQGIKKIQVRREVLLKHIEEIHIYEYYVDGFRLGEHFINPFRSDGHPSMSVFPTYTGKLHQEDWADSRFSGDVFDLLCFVYDMTLPEVVLMIDKDLGLGIWDSTATGKPIFTTREIIKKETLIQVIPRKFTAEELRYFNEYHIAERHLMDLRRDQDIEIYSINRLYINKKLMRLNELAFGYLYKRQYWKIYRPHGDKRTKWLSNVPLVQMYGLGNIPSGTGKAFVDKSVKDWLVTKVHLSTYVAGTQNESESAITQENIDYLLGNTEDCYVNFDPDPTGIKAAKYYTDQGFKSWTIPNNYYQEGIKDKSDFIKAFGPEALQLEIGKKIKL